MWKNRLDGNFTSKKGKIMDFGFTNDTIRYEKAIQYKNAAIADGWACIPLYPHESLERVARLEKDGFIMFIFTRTDIGSWKYEVSVSIWGPDGLAINPPEVYDMEKIKQGLATCCYCNKTNVETQRVGFAGRTCIDCLPEKRKELEHSGWRD